MRRSGSTLQYQLVSAIVKSTNSGQSLGWLEVDEISNLKYIDEANVLVIKTHDYFFGAAEMISEQKAKAIYVYRDIRDVIVSMMNKYNVTFMSVVTSKFIPTILSQYVQWTEVEGVMISRYEEMIEDLVSEVKRIVSYLDLNLDLTQIEEIAKNHSLDKQKKRIKEFKPTSQTTMSTQHLYDSKTLLHPNHIHSGKSEQWKTELKGWQIGIVECLTYDWLLALHYPVSQPWVNHITSKLIKKTIVFGQYAKRFLAQSKSYKV